MSSSSGWYELGLQFLGSVPATLVVSSLAFGVVLLIWRWLERRASSHLGHLLFLVPLTPLVLPLRLPIEIALPEGWRSASSPAAPENRERSSPAGEAIGLESSALPDRAPVSFGPTANALEPLRSRAESTPPSLSAMAMIAWVVISGILFLRLIAGWWQWRQSIAAAEDLQGQEGRRVREMLESLRRAHDLQLPERVVHHAALSGPAIWGLRRPVLIVAPTLVAALDDDQLEWVLLHELAHIARRDLCASALERGVQILWFFHPLAWLVARRTEALREEACDEAALALVSVRGGRRRRCATALLEVAALESSPTAPRPALWAPLHEDKQLMQQRIIRMLDTQRTPVAHTTPLARTGAILLSSLPLVQVGIAQEPERPLVQGAGPGVEQIEEVIEVDADPSPAIDRALEWLLALQASNGSWPTGPGTTEETGEFTVVGVTALVLLALEKSDHGKAAEAIEQGRAYLAAVQDERGLFGREVGSRVLQSHGMATLAWLRTRGAGEDSSWRPAAERAVQVILRAQNPYRAWRFDLQPQGDNGMFPTAILLEVLCEARDAGLEVPAMSMEHGLSWLEDMTDPSSGRTGYETIGGADARLAGRGEEFPTKYTELSTAMALVARRAAGQDVASSDHHRKGVFLISTTPPQWDRSRGKIDYYYWLYGTRAIEGLGDLVFEPWQEALIEALLPHQRDDGSWPALDAWSVQGTSVHSTAVCTLALLHAS